MKIRSVILNMVLFVLAAIGIAALTVSALNGGRWMQVWTDAPQTKVITFLLAYLLIARLSVHYMRGKRYYFRYTAALITALILTMGIFFLNNYWHYAGFASMFGWPEGVVYSSFLLEDLKYFYGLGIFRYVLAFICYIIVFFAVDNKGLIRGIIRLRKRIIDKILYYM